VNSADKKKLRAQAHSLKPVIMIGQSGLTAAVLAEIELALNSHELIKVRIRAEREDRSARKSALTPELNSFRVLDKLRLFTD